MRRLLFETVHYMALLPMLWLFCLHMRGQARDASAWWLAAAFAVSWAADSAAELVAPSDRWLVSFAYPVSQAAIVGAVLLTRQDAERLLAVLAVVAGVAVYWRGVSRPDVIVHTVAWLSVVGIVVDRWQLGALRTALLVYFGLSAACWLWYVMAPGWSPWLALQTSRVAGLLLTCRAFASTRPVLRVARC